MLNTRSRTYARACIYYTVWPPFNGSFLSICCATTGVRRTRRKRRRRRRRYRRHTITVDYSITYTGVNNRTHNARDRGPEAAGVRVRAAVSVFAVIVVRGKRGRLESARDDVKHVHIDRRARARATCTALDGV